MFVKLTRWSKARRKAVTLAQEQLALGVGTASKLVDVFALRHLNAIVVV